MKYVTLESGTDFRKIAKIMTKNGYRMNHATARNVLMSSLSNLVTLTAQNLKVDITNEQIDRVLKSQTFHEAIADVLTAIYPSKQ